MSRPIRTRHAVHPGVEAAKRRLLAAFSARPFDALEHASAARDLQYLVRLHHPRVARPPDQKNDYYPRRREECRQSSTPLS